MKHLRTGVILNTENYDECVAFYRDVFELRQMFSRDEGGHRLSCFELGAGYLMVETGGHARPDGKEVEENCTKLRFNVHSLEEARRSLRSWGIEAEISTFEWGSTINIRDPDGNRIGIREDSAFAAQIETQP